MRKQIFLLLAAFSLSLVVQATAAPPIIVHASAPPNIAQEKAKSFCNSLASVNHEIVLTITERASVSVASTKTSVGTTQSMYCKQLPVMYLVPKNTAIPLQLPWAMLSQRMADNSIYNTSALKQQTIYKYHLQHLPDRC